MVDRNLFNIKWLILEYIGKGVMYHYLQFLSLWMKWPSILNAGPG